ncbi:DUF1003 domain-containing protein [Pseudoclavibacter albus]|uniref:DUF1003 domain-containing protein n=1 Tax=Pseudoclavibacter albus TaxID=272241 RepID=UPI0009FA99EA|nr:DUF1003 domain-containing protein [Pseudoclavibacter alba]
MAATESRDFDEELAATPKSESRRRWRARSRDRDRDKEREPSDRLGRAMEAVARGMGTSMFLIILTIFVTIWMTWNSVAPEAWRFDSADIGFTALTLMLSLQASYAAPMLLLAQNRQDDRDRVQIEQDRQRAERNTADLEYLAREIVALRILVKDMATKDFIRAELRALLEDIEELDEDDDDEEPAAASGTDAARAILERREASRRRMRDRD